MALYVPERKVWTRQPQYEVVVNWANPITNGLVFAFNAGSGLVDLVSQKPLTVVGSVVKQGDTTGSGIYTAASADVAYCTLSQSIPTTGSVAVFELCKVNNTNVTRKRSLRLAGATGTVLSHDYSQGTDVYDFVGYQDSTSVFPNRYYSSYASNQVYINYMSHTTGDALPNFDRSGTPATLSNITGNGTRKEAITSVYIGNSSSGFPLTGLSYLCLVFSRSLSRAEQILLRENPWQIFAPRRQWFAFQPLNKLYVPERKVWTRQPQSKFALDNNLVSPCFLVNFADTGNRQLTVQGNNSARGPISGTVAKNIEDSTVGLKGGGSAGTSGYAGYNCVLSGYDLLMIFNFVTPPLNGRIELLCERSNDSNNSTNAANGAFFVALHSEANASNYSTTLSSIMLYGYSSGAIRHASFQFPTPEVGKTHTLCACFDNSVIGYNCIKWLYVDGKKVTPTGVLNAKPSTQFSTSTTDIYFNARNNTSLKSSNHLNLAAFVNYKTDESVAQMLSENPWQLFAPRRQWFALSQVANVQLLYPSSDISTGSWTPSTGTTLYGVLDEIASDSSDYIEAVTPTSCEIKFEAGAAPLVKTGHTLKYTLLSGTGSITVKLVQGTSVIKTWSHTLTGSEQNISSALSEAEAQTITNYADLRVRFET